MLAPSRREGGQVLILFALGLVAFMAILALAIDTGNIYVNRRVVQTAADTASLAGARAMTISGAAGQDVARAVCLYGGSNNFSGDATTVALADYVGTNGASLGTNVGTTPAPACPTPTTTVCTRPPDSTCGTIASNPIPAAAAGVRVRTAQTFNTYFAGIIGQPTFTVEAEATAQVGLASTIAGGSPFIACGTNMTPEDRAANSNSTVDGGINNNRWADASNSAVESIVTGTGPYSLKNTTWKANPPGPLATYPPSSNSFSPPPVGATPSGPGYVLHGVDVKTTCDTSNNWKGLSCVADASCPSPPNPDSSTMQLTLPAPSTNSPPYTALADGTNGNKVGLSANTVGPNGCGPGVTQRCVMIIPISVGGPGGSDDSYAAAWGAFWVDDCFASNGNTVTCGWFLGNYVQTGGTTSNTWTVGGSNGGGVVVIKLVA